VALYGSITREHEATSPENTEEDGGDVLPFRRS
jgi:hypothetical protein